MPYVDITIMFHIQLHLSFPSFLHSSLASFLLSLLLSFLNAASSCAIPCYFFWSHQSQPCWWPLYVISVPYYQIKCCGNCHKLIAEEPAQYAFGICGYIIRCSLCYLEYHRHTHTHTHTHTHILSLKDHTWITWVITRTCLHLTWVIHGSMHFCQ